MTDDLKANLEKKEELNQRCWKRIQELELANAQLQAEIVKGKQVEEELRRSQALNVIGLLSIAQDITEAKKAMEALRESEERFRQVLENSLDAAYRRNLLTDRYDYMSPVIKRITGFTPEEMNALSINEVLDKIHPHDLPELIQGIETATVNGRGCFEYRFCRKDGSYCWLADYVTVIKGDLGQPLYRLGIVRDITDRKQAEETLRESEERYRAFFDNSIDAVFITSPDGGVEAVNPVACRMFGMSEKEIIQGGRNLLVDHSDPRLGLALEERTRNGKFKGELNYRRKDGTIFPGEISNAVFRDRNGQEKTVLTIRDITERKRAEAENLASERKLLRVTLDSLGEGVLAVNQDRRIIFINESAARLIGCSQNDVIEQKIDKVFYVFDEQAGEPIDITSVRSGLEHPELVNLEGKKIPISLNWSPIKMTDGEIIGAVIVFQDISEKQKIEQEMLKTAKLDSLGILAGGVAHDFNNILAAILANMQLAMMKLRKHQDLAAQLEGVIEITRKASDLTKQLLTFAKGGDPVKKSTTITKLVKDTVQFALSGSKVKPEFHLPEDLWVIDIDEGQISQVINNLTINAEQAMLAGGILKIYGENINVENTGQYHPGKYVKLTVKDHGSGIPPEIINKIFDPFFTTKKTGNGLGLSTSYSIIKKHNGYLEVDSLPGTGAVFYILLPAPMVELTLTEAHREIIASGGARILLMEDEDTIRNVGGEMLVYYGYQVTLARDGREAIRLYKKANETGKPFEVVIMDLTVPGGLGGIETMAVLRQINPEVKAIISSGYANDPVMSDYERYGFSGVVTKPYKYDELIEVLNNVIERKQLSLELKY